MSQGSTSRDGRTRHGLSATASISAPTTSRSAVVPSAPISGNRLLAKVAPIWIDTMAPSSAPIGKLVASAAAIGVDVNSSPSPPWPADRGAGPG